MDYESKEIKITIHSRYIYGRNFIFNNFSQQILFYVKSETELLEVLYDLSVCVSISGEKHDRKRGK